MKDALLLMVLLSVRAAQVSSQPYRVDSDGRCLNPATEYVTDDSDLCCKKCPPGQRLTQVCDESRDSVCEQCGPGLFIESWNYAQNCFPCNKCKRSKGLLYAQNCSFTTRTRCTCKPGMYCLMESDDLHCTECRVYSLCRPGYGVSAPGTASSDVRCERCPEGTFSAALSSTDRCQPHTGRCHRKAVARKGNATADTECEDGAVPSVSFPDTTKGHHADVVLTAASATVSTVSTVSTAAQSSPTATEGLSNAPFNSSTKSPLPHKAHGAKLAVTAGVVGFTLLLLVVGIIIVLAFVRQADSKKDAAGFQQKVDANGNCATVDKIPDGYLEETQLISFTVTSAEQQSLLDRAGASSDDCQSSINTETLTRTDGGSSSHESMGALQSTVDMSDSKPALSEPMTLISNKATATPQPMSSQPSSPQIASPVTGNPHFNVNITFHIGNGSCGTPSVTPTHSTQSDRNLPFGEEEESFSIPRQEDGKESVTSVPDTAVYEETPP